MQRSTLQPPCARRSRLLAAGALLALTASACQTPIAKEPSLDPLALGPLEDVLSGPVEWSAVCSPGTLLALGGPADLERLLAWRTARAADSSAGLVLVDASGLDAAGAEALQDTLVLAALEPGGPLLLDRGGRWARRLCGPQAPPLLVDFLPDGRVALRRPLAP